MAAQQQGSGQAAQPAPAKAGAGEEKPADSQVEVTEGAEGEPTKVKAKVKAKPLQLNVDVGGLFGQLLGGVMAAAARRNRAPAKKLDIAVLEAWDRRSLRRHSGPQRDEQVLVETQVHAQAVSREGRGEHVRPKRQSNSHGFRRRWMRAAPPRAAQGGCSTL